MSIGNMDTSSLPAAEITNPSAKRKRSTSADAPAPPVKAAKTHSNHLQINYLARQYSDILPLISAEDPLPSLLSLISDYDGVLQRHESMAGNLGARPLGPMLIKRFERLFDGPPRVLKSHGKEGTTVGWLDVVEFARNKPEQFNLEKMRDGVRVCQFYTKQSRVEITEEDYQLIASGMPQKLIPPQPIIEDEEKELGTLEILEKHIGQVVQLADQVSARARQLNHRLKNRKNAIIARREAEAAAMEDTSSSRPKIVRVADMGQSHHTNGDQRASISPTSGFVAVNSRQSYPNENPLYDTSANEHPRTANVTIVNGTSLHGASAATRAELLSKFFTNSERSAAVDQDPPRRGSMTTTSRPFAPSSKSKTKPTADSTDYANTVNSTSPVPIPNTPSSLLPQVKPSPADRFDDSGPYKAEMVARMEQLLRGDRIMPPCDRCRRLHMDCLKNLTACMGCTKKHAKCSWKDVLDDELRENPFVARVGMGADKEEGTGAEGGFENLPVITAVKTGKEYLRDEGKMQQGVRDEELLGEDSEDEAQRDEHVPGYLNPGQELTSTSEPVPTNQETNDSISPDIRPRYENNDPLATQPLNHSTTSPTESHTTASANPNFQEDSRLSDPHDPGSPQLSVHAVGRSVELASQPQPDPQTDQEHMDKEYADRVKDHDDGNRIAQQLVKAVFEEQEGLKGYGGEEVQQS